MLMPLLRHFTQVDTWRAARTGFPEVIWGPGKSAEQIAAIISRLAETEAAVIVTRVTPEVSSISFQSWEDADGQYCK